MREKLSDIDRVGPINSLWGVPSLNRVGTHLQVRAFVLNSELESP